MRKLSRWGFVYDFLNVSINTLVNYFVSRDFVYYFCPVNIKLLPTIIVVALLRSALFIIPTFTSSSLIRQHEHPHRIRNNCHERQIFPCTLSTCHTLCHPEILYKLVTAHLHSSLKQAKYPPLIT